MNKSNEIYKRRINQVIDYVNNNLEKSFSLEELAAVAFFSPFHFHRIFMAVTGESVNYFTNRIRLELVATATHYLFNNWLINSSFEPDHQPGLEIFLDKENICNWNHFDLELCIPIKNNKTS